MDSTSAMDQPAVVDVVVTTEATSCGTSAAHNLRCTASSAAAMVDTVSASKTTALVPKDSSCHVTPNVAPSLPEVVVCSNDDDDVNFSRSIHATRTDVDIDATHVVNDRGDSQLDASSLNAINDVIVSHLVPSGARTRSRANSDSASAIETHAEDVFNQDTRDHSANIANFSGICASRSDVTPLPSDDDSTSNVAVPFVSYDATSEQNNNSVCSTEVRRAYDSDTQADRSRTPSPKRYEKRKSYSPDTRHSRKFMPQSKMKTSAATAQENHFNSTSSVPSLETGSATSAAAAEEEEPVEEATVLSSKPKDDVTAAKSKFVVQKVEAHVHHDDVVANGSATGSFSRHGRKNVSNLRLDLTKISATNNNAVSDDKSQNCDDVRIEIPPVAQQDNDVTSNGVTSCNGVNTSTNTKNGDVSKVVKFKADLLDSDVVYTWTLEKKNRYAAEIRKIKMTLESRPPPPADYIVLSCLVIFCCNPLFGLIALYLSSKYTIHYYCGW